MFSSIEGTGRIALFVQINSSRTRDKRTKRFARNLVIRVPDHYPDSILTFKGPYEWTLNAKYRILDARRRQRATCKDRRAIDFASILVLALRIRIGCRRELNSRVPAVYLIHSGYVNQRVPFRSCTIPPLIISMAISTEFFAFRTKTDSLRTLRRLSNRC